MSESGRALNCRLKLEAAKLMFEHMMLDFQDERKFRYFLDAFLALARSVPHILKSEFHNETSLAGWYELRAMEFYSSRVVKLLVEMRNISLKEHTPMMVTTAAVSFSLNAIIGDNPDTKKISTEGDTENMETTSPKASAGWTAPKIVSYSFDELPTWFDENPDVMYLCRKYLDELEKLVAEAEKMVGRKVLGYE